MYGHTYLATLLLDTSIQRVQPLMNDEFILTNVQYVDSCQLKTIIPHNVYRKSIYSSYCHKYYLYWDPACVLPHEAGYWPASYSTVGNICLLHNHSYFESLIPYNHNYCTIIALRYRGLISELYWQGVTKKRFLFIIMYIFTSCCHSSCWGSTRVPKLRKTRR